MLVISQWIPISIRRIKVTPLNTCFIIFPTMLGDQAGNFSEGQQKEIFGSTGVTPKKHVFGPYTLIWFGEDGIKTEPNSSMPQTLQLGPPSDRNVHLHIYGDWISVFSDWAGTVPIFWGFSDQGLIITSEFAFARYAAKRGLIPSEVDLHGIGNLLKFSHQVGSETIFSGVHRVPSGKRLKQRFSDPLTPPEFEPSEKIRPMDLSNLSETKQLSMFREINAEVVGSSLGSEDKVILPLSSGYDSRLVLAGVIDTPGLKRKLVTATYGPGDSIEVSAGRKLAAMADVPWFHVSINEEFLQRKYLIEIGRKFGSTLHMHGMYQLLFWDALAQQTGLEAASLTSGFMTGVPAGQHLDKLGKHFTSGSRQLLESMEEFAQSKAWRDDEISSFTRGVWTRQIARGRLEADFNNLNQMDHLASMEFDIFARQARFISYHPETLSLRTKVLSPHMNSIYASFLWGLSVEQLHQRRFIGSFFKAHHPQLASVISNSHHFSRLGNPLLAGLNLASRAMARVGIPRFLPNKYWDAPIQFDDAAAGHHRISGLWPLFEQQTRDNFSDAGLAFDFQSALTSVMKAPPRTWYQKYLPLQSLAYDLYEQRA